MVCSKVSINNYIASKDHFVIGYLAKATLDS